MLICLAAECTATYSLSKYETQQTNIELDIGHTAQVHNNDIIAAECLTIVFCVFVATLFGADFFFLLFWPRRRYPRWYSSAKKLLAVGITMGVLAAALMSTIIVATRSAFITGVGPDTAQQYANFFYRPPLKYRAWPTNIAHVVLLWLGFLATAASTAVMFIASDHDELHGTEPKSTLEDDQPITGEKGRHY
ncbi:hypothetical protein HGRIS_009377 [Hohenbuehelia grisea]|uniref:Uncharacterized protein n=1 Tax=Hohenbuehelia grisea TaxID=104357 RepID=A0ABR3J2C4_9AGAR